MLLHRPSKSRIISSSSSWMPTKWSPIELWQRMAVTQEQSSRKKRIYEFFGTTLHLVKNFSNLNRKVFSENSNNNSSSTSTGLKFRQSKSRLLQTVPRLSTTTASLSHLSSKAKGQHINHKCGSHPRTDLLTSLSIWKLRDWSKSRNFRASLNRRS